MEKVMHTTRCLQKNLCTQLVVREKNIHKLFFKQLCTQVVRTSLARIKLMLKNHLTNVISRSYAPKLCA
jgi:hypothetical protein